MRKYELSAGIGAVSAIHGDFTDYTGNYGSISEIYQKATYYDRKRYTATFTLNFVYNFTKYCNYQDIEYYAPYRISVSDGGLWSLEYDSETAVMSALVRISGGVMVVETIRLEADYGNDRVNISSVPECLMKMPLTTDGSFSPWPESGKLNVVVKGAESLSDSFTVEFGEAVKIIR